jgi:hypothetical protein
MKSAKSESKTATPAKPKEKKNELFPGTAGPKSYSFTTAGEDREKLEFIAEATGFTVGQIVFGLGLSCVGQCLEEMDDVMLGYYLTGAYAAARLDLRGSKGKVA